MRLKTLKIVESRADLDLIPKGKILINTINAHSYNVAQKDTAFAAALTGGDYLVPDGASIVKACRWIHAASQPKERIAGWDLFIHEMNRTAEEAQQQGEQRTVMFMGSSEKVLSLIRQRCAAEYPMLHVETYSPPYCPEFSPADSTAIINAINQAQPDLLWIGMTAPKQEKWTYEHWHELDIHCHVGTIGAVFDFFAGTVKRAPRWWQDHSLEWLYRLIKEPRRLWRRYIIGNMIFIWNMRKETLSRIRE